MKRPGRCVSSAGRTQAPAAGSRIAWVSGRRRSAWPRVLGAFAMLGAPLDRGRVAALLLALALAGCSKPAPVPEAQNTPAPAPAGRAALEINTLPALRYAGVVYEPRSGAISPAADASGATASLTLQATAPSKAEVPLDGQLTLEFSNGAQVRTGAHGLGSAQVTDVTLTGTVPAGTVWQGATLTLTESGKPPQRVTVGAPAPVSEVALTPGPEVNAPTRYGEPVTYAVSQAVLLLNGPRTGGFYERTSDAQRFLRVVVSALNKGGRNGVSIGQESFELWANGQSLNQAVGIFARTIAYNQSNDFELFYRVPADAKSLTLKVGTDGKHPGQIELTRAP